MQAVADKIDREFSSCSTGRLNACEALANHAVAVESMGSTPSDLCKNSNRPVKKLPVAEAYALNLTHKGLQIVQNTTEVLQQRV
jgi:hypothetical protein